MFELPPRVIHSCGSVHVWTSPGNITLSDSASVDNLLFPTESASCLILDHARLEEVPLLLQIDHLAHPGERIGRARVELFHADLLTTTVRNVTKVLLEYRRVQSQHATRHRVLRVAVFELDRLLDQPLHLLPERRCP